MYMEYKKENTIVTHERKKKFRIHKVNIILLKEKKRITLIARTKEIVRKSTGGKARQKV